MKSKPYGVPLWEGSSVLTGEPGLVALVYCRAGGVAVGCQQKYFSVFLASGLRIKHPTHLLLLSG